MGLTSSTSNIKYVKVAYEGGDKDAGKPSFGVVGKKNDKWEVIETGTSISGKIIGIEKDQYEYRNKPQYQYKLKIQDGSDIFSLELGYGFFSRSLLNSISGIGDLSGKVITLSIYRSKKDFVTIYTTYVEETDKGVSGSEQRAEWELKPENLPGTDDDKWLDSFDYFINKIQGCLAPEEINQEKSDSSNFQVENPTQHEEDFAKRKADSEENTGQVPDVQDDLPF